MFCVFNPLLERQSLVPMDLLPPVIAASSSSGLATPSGFISSSFSHRRRRKLPHFFLNGSTSAAKKEEKTAIRTSRRSFVFFLLFPMPIALSPSLSDSLSPTLLECYTDEINGFTLLKPSTWAQTEKAGADVLFEEEKGSNNIGVVVSPVRISSLKDFGTAEFTAEKLIQAERRKESTKSVELVAIAERLGNGGQPVYEFEYVVDSTRGGTKRIFSAAFIASKKLYLLNISYSDRPESPLDDKTRTFLQQILHSFGSTL